MVIFHSHVCLPEGSLASVIITVTTIDCPRGVDEMLETLRISKVWNLMEPRAPVRLLSWFITTTTIVYDYAETSLKRVYLVRMYVNVCMYVNATSYAVVD